MATPAPPAAPAVTVVAAPAAKPARHTFALLFVLLILGVAAAYGVYYERQKQEEASEASAAAAAKTAAAAAAKTAAAKAAAPPPPPKPLTEKEKIKEALALRNCSLNNYQTGTCAYDVTLDKTYLKCKKPFYGVDCRESCVSSNVKPREYTAGSDTQLAADGKPLARPPQPVAKCECPAKYHFKDRDVKTGCRAGGSTGDVGNCEPGFFGTMCDQKGKYLDCGSHGTLIAGKCICQAGYTGEYCEYDGSTCNTLDPKATINTSDGSCTCSPGYMSKPGSSGMGATCNQCDTAAGYYKKTVGGQERCVAGTICEVVVFGSGGQKTPPLKNELGTATAFKMSDYGLTEVWYLQVKRIRGTEACSVRLHLNADHTAQKKVGCDLEDIVLPEGKVELTSLPFSSSTNSYQVDTVTIGPSSDVQAVPTKGGMCPSLIDGIENPWFSSDTTDCPGAPSGNVCGYVWDTLTQTLAMQDAATATPAAGCSVASGQSAAAYKSLCESQTDQTSCLCTGSLSVGSGELKVNDSTTKRCAWNGSSTFTCPSSTTPSTSSTTPSTSSTTSSTSSSTGQAAAAAASAAAAAKADATNAPLDTNGSCAAASWTYILQNPSISDSCLKESTKSGCLYGKDMVQIGTDKSFCEWTPSS